MPQNRTRRFTESRWSILFWVFHSFSSIRDLVTSLHFKIKIISIPYRPTSSPYQDCSTWSTVAVRKTPHTIKYATLESPYGIILHHPLEISLSRKIVITWTTPFPTLCGKPASDTVSRRSDKKKPSYITLKRVHRIMTYAHGKYSKNYRSLIAIRAVYKQSEETGESCSVSSCFKRCTFVKLGRETNNSSDTLPFARLL